MTSRVLKLPPFQNVAASSRALLPNVPLGYVYDGFVLKLGDSGTFEKNDIDLLEVKLAGKTIIEATGDELDAIQQYLGRTANASYLAVYFADPNAPDVVGENVGALDTMSRRYSSLQIGVTLNSTPTAPTLEAWGLIGRPKPPEFAETFRALLRTQQSIPAAKVEDLTPAVGLGTRLARLHVFHANLTALEVKQRGVDLVDSGELGVMQYLQNELSRTTQSGHFAYDRQLRDRFRSALALFDQNGPIPTQFRGTFSSSDTVELLSEVYGTIQSI